jgi:hypothetical protein
MSSNDLEKLQKFIEKRWRIGEMLPKPTNVEFGSLLGVVYNLYLQNMTLPCKNSKQKLAGNAAKHQEKLQKFSVYTQKISSKQI